MHDTYQHITVLLHEAVAALALPPAAVCVDGTFGRGGHSALILQQLAPQARLLAFDKDPRAIETGLQLQQRDARFTIIQDSFASMQQHLQQQQLCGAVDAVLLDLGVSSPQLDDASRGFSFNHDGPLDMRMDPASGISAADWLAQADAEAITRVFKDYGEERFARRMAQAIVRRREEKPFTRTADLAEVISAANPAWEKGKHPATRAFQALRIQVNNELGDLERGLQAAYECLAVGGRLVVISFHSLEDRIVKNFMRRLAKGEPDTRPRHLPVQSIPFDPALKLIGKPVYAGEQELKANPRSRSAVMRVAEKLR